MPGILSNNHRFRLVPSQAESLVAMVDVAARHASLEDIVYGRAPGWVCARCGMSILELLQLATVVGRRELLSSMVVRCNLRPHTMIGMLRGECAAGAVLHSELTRVDATLRQQLCSSMLDMIKRGQWLVPVLDAKRGESLVKL